MNKTHPIPQKKRSRLKKSILSTMVIVPFIPFILAVGVGFYHFSNALESKTTGALKRIVEDHRQMIEAFLMERQSDLELVAGTHGYEKMKQSGSIEAIFSLLKKKSGAFVDLGVFNSDGIHVCYTGPYALEGKHYINEPWFKKVLKDGYFISDIFLGYRMVPHFIIAVRQGKGKNTWVLRATIDTQFFDQLVGAIRIGRTGEALVFNRSGIPQTLQKSGGQPFLNPDPDFKKFPLPDKHIIMFIQPDSSGEDCLYAATWLKNKDWLLVVRQKKKDAYQELYTSAVISLAIMVSGGAVILMMAVFTTGRILKNIDQLGLEKETLGYQLIRATQLAEIGEMATGFAHEINNPLQIIKGEHALIESLLEDPAPDREEIADSLNQIRLQVNRCADITHSILKFGRENDFKPEQLNLQMIIPEIIRMIAKKAQVNGIHMDVTVPEGLPGFMGDPSQFQQVMLNLINNAMDAVAERHGSSGGNISIAAAKTLNNRIRIRITDNGSGIRPENMEKIFSPFFTTKPVGKGTGLGLSVCYGIIENFGGTMAVESRPDHGTTFVIDLPSIEEKQEDRRGKV